MVFALLSKKDAKKIKDDFGIHDDLYVLIDGIEFLLET